jgi:hypothetical protein
MGAEFDPKTLWLAVREKVSNWKPKNFQLETTVYICFGVVQGHTIAKRKKGFLIY